MLYDLKTIELFLNLPFLEVEKVELEKHTLHIYCHSILEETICTKCLQKINEVKKVTIREVRDLSITGKTVILHLRSRQFHCADCNSYNQEQFTFVKASHTMTERYEAYVYICCKNSSIERVSVQENIVWDCVQKIYTIHAKSETAFLQKHQPKRIGIDEFAIKKGHKDFATVIVDLDKGYVLDVLDFRTKDELIAYFKAKGSAYCENIEVFSCDLWDGFISTAKSVFPNADIVTDRFHFFKLLHEVLDKERKKLRREFKDEQDFKTIKWLLFKAWEQLHEVQRRTLLRAFRKSPILRQLYFAKNELRNIFESHITKEQAQKLVTQWVETVKEFKHNVLDTFLKTIERHNEIILNFFTHRVSNGIVEGINNAIKALKRNGFGYRNFDNFKLRIIANFC
jgi:transposase